MCMTSATLTAPSVEGGSPILTTSPTVFKRDKQRALLGVAECPFGTSGTLQTTREGKPPAESRAAVSTSDASSDTEPGSPVLNNCRASIPERRRAG